MESTVESFTIHSDATSTNSACYWTRATMHHDPYAVATYKDTMGYVPRRISAIWKALL